MTKPATKLKEEFFKLLLPTIYFFVALHIVAFVRMLPPLEFKATRVAARRSIATFVRLRSYRPMPQKLAKLHLNPPRRPILVTFVLPRIPLQLKPNNNGETQ